MVTMLVLLPLVLTTSSVGAEKNRLIVNVDLGKEKINRNIYGHFAEHLGNCIYDGIWVGEDSEIPNINGYRKDVVEALEKIVIPTLRWPGGCFADEYHWMDGIGPRENRPTMINTHWGGVVEDNSFGTHEFLNFCELIGAEPYLSLNMGSGTVEEMSKWVEYVNSDGESPMANLRRKNGREKPWNVKYIGVGNESWGCGGEMRPEFYADLYRRYAIYCRNYGDNRLFKIASGASDYDFNWTQVLMKNIDRRMQGISLHYYTVKGWQGSKGSATDFTMAEYIRTLEKCMGIETVLKRHISIMDQHDPDNTIGLIVDEWGTWWDVEPGTNPGFLNQQNTLRDAFVAAITLNIFHKYCDRIKMANIAQLVNVLQSLFLTKNEKTVLTPTYYVFDLYQVHQDAVFLPSELIGNDYELDGVKVPALNASASKSADGTINISIVNVHPQNAAELDVDFYGASIKKVTGKILTAQKISDHNTFDNPDAVRIAEFNGAKIINNRLQVKIPAKSIIVLRLN